MKIKLKSAAADQGSADDKANVKVLVGCLLESTRAGLGSTVESDHRFDAAAIAADLVAAASSSVEKTAAQLDTSSGGSLDIELTADAANSPYTVFVYRYIVNGHIDPAKYTPDFVATELQASATQGAGNTLQSTTLDALMSGVADADKVANVIDALSFAKNIISANPMTDASVTNNGSDATINWKNGGGDKPASAVIVMASFGGNGNADVRSGANAAGNDVFEAAYARFTWDATGSAWVAAADPQTNANGQHSESIELASAGQNTNPTTGPASLAVKPKTGATFESMVALVVNHYGDAVLGIETPSA